MLSKQFGMKESSSINALMNRQTKIPLKNLVSIGRNLTLEQYFKIKKDFESDPQAKAKMIRDRETYIIYKNDEDDDNTPKDVDMSDTSSEKASSEKAPKAVKKRMQKSRDTNESDHDQATKNAKSILSSLPKP